MSKIAAPVLADAVRSTLSHDGRPMRRFVESVDIQVNLKNYDTAKDRRFSGALRLPAVCRPSLSVCLIADLAHLEAAKKAAVPAVTADDLKKLGKNKKLVKKFGHRYDRFLASDTIIKTLPRLIGPHMSRLSKFPLAVSHAESLEEKVRELRSTVKFQLKKVLCLGACVGHMAMDEETLRRNVVMAVNFLVSLLKKNWHNMKSIYLKSTMGRPHRLF